MNLIVGKYTTDRQLGHLYEHIILSSLSDKLRQKGYLSFLDYDISGDVSEFGIITLVLNFKKYVEKDIVDFVKNNKADFTEDVIASAALQIRAEKYVGSDGF